MVDSAEDNENARYPIGRFQRPPSVGLEQRQQWIETITSLPAEMRDAVADLDQAQLDTRYRENGWKVRQVVHHVADSHINSYVRFRWALTEETPLIKAYEEGAWAELEDAKTADAGISLNLLEALHARWVRLLTSMDDSAFARTLRHPSAGELRLDTMTGLYAWHGRHHVAHITQLRKREGW